MIMRSFTIVALLLLSQVSRAQNNAVGVLVGIHSLGSDSAADSRPSSGGSLRTVWIPLDPRDGTSRITPVEISDLLIPRRTGFWRAGLLGTCVENSIEDIDGKSIGTGASVADHFWAAPLGARPQVRLTEPDERVGSCTTRSPRCENDNRTIVYWVWPEYVSLDMSERSGCGVHPDWSPGYTVRRLDSLDKPLTVPDILGASAEVPFRSALQSAEREFRAAAANPCEPDPFESDSWYIERKDGRWRTMGWNKASRACAYGFDFEASLDLSKITARPDDTPRWKQIKTRMPQIIDAHFSPAGPWLLVATDNQLMILPDAASSKPSVTVRLSKFEKIIMVEWATGRNVSRWDDEVRRVRGAGRPEPVVR